MRISNYPLHQPGPLNSGSWFYMYSWCHHVRRTFHHGYKSHSPHSHGPCLSFRPYLGESDVKLSHPSIPRGPQASQGPQAPQGAPSTPGGPKHSRGPQAPQGAPSTPGGPKYPRGTPRHGNLGQSSRSLCPWALHDGCPELYSVKGSSQVLYAAH